MMGNLFVRTEEGKRITSSGKRVIWDGLNERVPCIRLQSVARTPTDGKLKTINFFLHSSLLLSLSFCMCLVSFTFCVPPSYEPRVRFASVLPARFWLYETLYELASFVSETDVSGFILRKRCLLTNYMQYRARHTHHNNDIRIITFDIDIYTRKEKNVYITFIVPFIKNHSYINKHYRAAKS